MIEKQVKFFKALSDASRLKLIASLMDGPSYVELLAQRMELSPSTVSFHLKKLEEVGIVSKEKDQYYTLYSINQSVLNAPIANWLIPKSDGNTIEDEREAQYRQKILETFFKFNKLKSIPVQRKKRLVVLDHLVSHFEKNKIYTEKEVNLIIADFHDDFATLRREFINEKLMKRENGSYWRL